MRQLGFPGDAVVKNPPTKAGDARAGSLGQEDPLEEGMATHSNIFAWRIPWSEEPGRLQSLQTQRVGHDRDIKKWDNELLEVKALVA